MADIRRDPQARGANLLRAGSRFDIDETDIALIRLLQSDGRMSFVEIANRLSIAEKTVRKRIAELRAASLMEITTVTDPRGVGFNSIAMAGIRINSQFTRAEVAERLFDIGAVDYAVTTFGPFDILVELVCQDDRELTFLFDERVRRQAGVQSLEVFPYLSLHYQQPAWDHAQAKSPPVEPQPRQAIDDVDRMIIHHLSQDGRTPFLEISRVIGVSESQIRKRYSRLVEGKILQVLAITNPRSLGYETSAWLGLRVAAESGVTDVADKLSTLASVAYLSICAGQFDIMVELICRDRDDLFRIIEEHIRKLSGISQIQIFICDNFFYRKISPS